MSRRIGEDFEEFSRFLEGYSLKPFFSAQIQLEKYKMMHKKVYGFLIFKAEFIVQGIHPDSTILLDETSSDLLLSLFCAVQGLYKPSKLQLRCSIEAFMKSLVMISDPNIIYEKSVYSIFDSAKKDYHFSTQIGLKFYNNLHNTYSFLCETAHSAPQAMKPISALGVLPQFNIADLQMVSDNYNIVVESILGVLYLNYPMVLDQMHPDNKKDFLDCLSSTTKSDLNKALFSE